MSYHCTGITVGKLRQILEGVPDDTPILVPANDHSYREPGAHVTTALYDNGTWTEDHGEEFTSEEDYGKRMKVVVID